MKNYCGRFSSNLITNELLLNPNSTLKNELEFIFEKKLSTIQNNTHFGVNTDIKGIFKYQTKTYLLLIYLKNDVIPFRVPKHISNLFLVVPSRIKIFPFSTFVQKFYIKPSLPVQNQPDFWRRDSSFLFASAIKCFYCSFSTDFLAENNPLPTPPLSL